MKRFDPNKGEFPAFVQISLDRSCRSRNSGAAIVSIDEGNWPDPTYPMPTPEEDAIRRQAIESCLRRLTPFERHVLQLHGVAEFSHVEIAEREGHSVAKVKVTYFRAKHKMRECLERKGTLL